MIIQYDTRPTATIDEKIRSLIESIQLALGEIGIDASNTSTSQSTDISTVIAEIRELTDTVSSFSVAITNIDENVTELTDSITVIQGNITSLDERVTALEERDPDPEP